MSEPPLPRAQFPVTRQWSFLNNAGVAPLPQVARDATARYLDEASTGGSVMWDEHGALVERVRRQAAALLRVPVDDVAFVRNTTHGISVVAGGLDWRPGDRVIVPAFEFPSNVYPWLALQDRGVQVELLQPVGRARALPLELFEEALARAPARVVAVSWVQFGRGWRTDLAGLAQLCREHGALLSVDAIQGAGVLPADLATWGVDFAAADGHKWLLGPPGVGVLYVAGPRRQLLRPLEPGWNAVAHRQEWDNLALVWDDSARRFEGGSAPVGLLAALGASVELLLHAGVDAVWRHVEHLTALAAQALARAGAVVLSDRDVGRSGVLTFEIPGVDPVAACDALRTRRVVASPRGGGIRVSPHGYNDEADVEALVRAVGELAA